MTWILRIVLGHGEVGIGHHIARGIDMQGAVGRRHAVVVVVAPVAAYL